MGISDSCSRRHDSSGASRQKRHRSCTYWLRKDGRIFVAVASTFTSVDIRKSTNSFHQPSILVRQWRRSVRTDCGADEGARNADIQSTRSIGRSFSFPPACELGREGVGEHGTCVDYDRGRYCHNSGTHHRSIESEGGFVGAHQVCRVGWGGSSILVWLQGRAGVSQPLILIRLLWFSELKKHLPKKFQSITTSATLDEDMSEIKQMFASGTVVSLKLKVLTAIHLFILF